MEGSEIVSEIEHPPRSPPQMCTKHDARKHTLLYATRASRAPTPETDMSDSHTVSNVYTMD